jgi:hypothetical protein
MRLDINRWYPSSSRTALELIPCGRVRPTAAYFRSGHRLLDSLTQSLPQHFPPQHLDRPSGVAELPDACDESVDEGYTRQAVAVDKAWVCLGRFDWIVTRCPA